jgi:glutamine transport system permease protein
MELDWSVIFDYLPLLWIGAKTTIIITLAGVIGGLILGMLLGMVRTYGGKISNAIAITYIELIRGTPIVVQVMFIYFALPVLVDIRIDNLTAAIFAIVINAAAYIAEIVRGAFLSVNPKLTEAGLAIGLPKWKVYLYIVGPLALRRLLPPLGNQFIISLKDTSLFIVIGVGELTRTGQEIMASNFRAVEIWTAVAIIYLIMTTIISFSLRRLEKRMKIL